MKKQHVLAKLRDTIGKSQKEMSALIDCSWDTIRSIECGRLALSEKLAERISEATGVDIFWLLNGDADAPIVNTFGEQITKQTFEEFAASRDFKGDGRGLSMANYSSFSCIALLGLYLGIPKERLPILQYRINEFICDLYKELRPQKVQDRDGVFAWWRVMELATESAKQWKNTNPKLFAETIQSTVLTETGVKIDQHVKSYLDLINDEFAPKKQSAGFDSRSWREAWEPKKSKAQSKTKPSTRKKP